MRWAVIVRLTFNMKRFKIVSCLVLCLVFLSIVLGYAVFSLPATLYDSASKSILIKDRFDQDMYHVMSREGEYRRFVKLDRLNPALIQMFIASEDKRFFKHSGVDLKALLRAIKLNVNSGHIVSGASAITMQLVRMIWPKLSKKRNKWLQMLQAWRIERHHSKEEILEYYFNHVPFAYQVSGVGQACMFFFNQDCSRLSLSQNAVLSIIPRNPSMYTKNRSALLKKRNNLLDRVKLSLNLHDADVRVAKQEELMFFFKKPKLPATHFLDFVMKHQRAQTPIVKTTLDLNLQQFSQNALDQHIKEHPDAGDAGSIIVINHRDSSVQAYVGGSKYFESEHGMVDMVHTPRSPGSALKPLLYILALEKGATLSTLMTDLPRGFHVNGGSFLPENYAKDFSGMMQLRYALANSKNLPALSMTKSIGEGIVLGFFKSVGLATLGAHARHYGIGLSLGNGEVTLWELARAYHQLASLGKATQVKWLLNDSLIDRDVGNKVLKEFQVADTSPDSVIERVYDAANAFLITDALQDRGARIEELGRNHALTFDFPVASKTGTSSDFRDHWVMGYSSDYTVGVWKGNADGRPMQKQQSSIENTGVLFRDVMQYLHKQKAGSKFMKPEHIVEKRVCALSGDLVGPHCQVSRLEYFDDRDLQGHHCAMHKAVVVDTCHGERKTLEFVDLPEGMEAWGDMMNMPSFKKILKLTCDQDSREYKLAHHIAEKAKAGAAFIYPLSNTIYALDPHIPKSHQKIRLQWSVRSIADLSLWDNDQQLLSIKNKTISHFDWTMRKGKHTFKIQNNDHTLAITTIDVR